MELQVINCFFSTRSKKDNYEPASRGCTTAFLEKARRSPQRMLLGTVRCWSYIEPAKER